VICILLLVIILLLIPGMRQIVGVLFWGFVILMWWSWPATDTSTTASRPTATIERSQ
jgi:hypothetical protein